MREMKESNVYYLKQIPKSWSIKKFKNFSQCRMGETILSEETVKDGIPVYSATQADKIFGYTSNAKFILNKGDIVIPARGNSIGCATLVKEDKATCTQTTIGCYNIRNIDNKFYYYVIIGLKDEWFKYDGSAIPQITVEQVKNNKLAIPTMKEQKKIVNFLEEKIIEIDNVIEKTKLTIEDYNIYKQSIIFKCVTSGIKNNEKEKCRIDWIKEKPVNWKILKISQIFSQVKCKNKDLVEKNLLSLSYGKVKRRNIDAKEGLLPENFEGYNIIEKDDIVLRLTDLQNDHKSLRVGRNIERGIITSAYITIRNKLNKDSRYYYYLLHSFDICKGFYGMGSGVRQGLTFEEIKKMEILVPPNDEQNDIADYLDKQSQMIEKLILKKKKLIEELDKYKKSLIYEYVTGKKEVGEKKFNYTDNINAIKINCKDNIFAQAILLCKIIEKLRNYNLGRVKAEKTLYLIEKEVGFDFNNKYVREVAGPLSENIYICESIISKNKWVNIKKVKKYIKYEILPNFNKYSKYYDKYYSSYDSQIEKIIDIVKNYSTDKAEMVATLYAAWNDFIIKKDKVSDKEIVKDVRENWNDRKKRFNEREWLEVLEEMKQNGLTPKGNGNLTVIKE